MRVLPRSTASWPRGRARSAGAGTLLVIALTAGCGLVEPLVDPAAGTGDQSSSAPSADTDAPATSPRAAAAAPTPPAAAADLKGSADDDRPASLSVSVTGPEPGVPPVTTTDGPLAAECGFDAAATEYATLAVVFTDPTPVTKGRATSSNLRLDVTTVGGRDIGVVVETYNPSTYCDGTTLPPARSELQSQNLSDEHQTMTFHVVARTSPAVPHPLQGVTVQLLGLRHHADGIDSRAWNWDVQQVTAGKTCPQDPRSLCLPLG